MREKRGGFLVENNKSHFEGSTVDHGRSIGKDPFKGIFLNDVTMFGNIMKLCVVSSPLIKKTLITLLFSV